MKFGFGLLLANTPTLVCAGMGGLMADRGHSGFAVALLVLAFIMAHYARSEEKQ